MKSTRDLDSSSNPRSATPSCVMLGKAVPSWHLPPSLVNEALPQVSIYSYVEPAEMLVLRFLGGMSK